MGSPYAEYSGTDNDEISSVCLHLVSAKSGSLQFRHKGFQIPSHAARIIIGVERKWFSHLDTYSSWSKVLVLQLQIVQLLDLHR